MPKMKEKARIKPNVLIIDLCAIFILSLICYILQKNRLLSLIRLS